MVACAKASFTSRPRATSLGVKTWPAAFLAHQAGVLALLPSFVLTSGEEKPREHIALDSRGSVNLPLLVGFEEGVRLDGRLLRCQSRHSVEGCVKRKEESNVAVMVEC